MAGHFPQPQGPCWPGASHSFDSCKTFNISTCLLYIALEHCHVQRADGIVVRHYTTDLGDGRRRERCGLPLRTRGPLTVCPAPAASSYLNSALPAQVCSCRTSHCPRYGIHCQAMSYILSTESSCFTRYLHKSNPFFKPPSSAISELRFTCATGDLVQWTVW